MRRCQPRTHALPGAGPRFAPPLSAAYGLLQNLQKLLHLAGPEADSNAAWVLGSRTPVSQEGTLLQFLHPLLINYASSLQTFSRFLADLGLAMRA